MFNYRVKIGLVPMRRNVSERPEGTPFNRYAAERRAEKYVEILKRSFSDDHVSFVDTYGLGMNGVVYDNKSATEVAERFKTENVDAIFIINCNFGNEEAAGELARELGKPVLLWAPLDDEYYSDSIRPTDSQCGLFGVARQLQRYHIPFSHLPGLSLDDSEVKDGIKSFLRVACMVKNFKNMTIGLVGTRTSPFYSVIWNEGELMEKFGIRIVTFNMATIQQKFNFISQNNTDEIKKYSDYINSNYEMDEQTPQYVSKMATLVVLFKQLFNENNLSVMTGECWTAFPVMFGGLTPCTAYGILNDLGYNISCESDIHAAMTMALLSCASFGEKKCFLGEFTVRHPENKNAELLWHCGQFPLSCKAPDCNARQVNQHEWFRGKDGTYTLARIDQESGSYMILPLLCHTTEGPQTHGTYIWGEFDDLQAVEDRLLDGPYIHHFVEMEGDYRKEIAEFCKYFPNLKVDKTLNK